MVTPICFKSVRSLAMLTLRICTLYWIVCARNCARISAMFNHYWPTHCMDELDKVKTCAKMVVVDSRHQIGIRSGATTLPSWCWELLQKKCYGCICITSVVNKVRSRMEVRNSMNLLLVVGPHYRKYNPVCSFQGDWTRNFLWNLFGDGRFALHTKGLYCRIWSWSPMPCE